jgi:hypothetical protein
MNQFAHGRLEQRGALTANEGRMQLCAPPSQIERARWSFFFPFSPDPFMHAQPTNGLLAARDYAGSMTPQRCMKEAGDA